jgi:hypothetical protein
MVAARQQFPKIGPAPAATQLASIMGCAVQPASAPVRELKIARKGSLYRA